MNEVLSNNVIAFHPGYYVNEIIEALEITQSEFAKRLGVAEKMISQLINGKSSMSKELARKLSLATNISIGTWLNQQAEYDRRILEDQKNKTLEHETKYFEILDYKYFTDLGLVPQTKDKLEKAENLLKFFNISSFSVLEREDFLVCYRTATRAEDHKKIACANAWVQTALNCANHIETSPFDEKRLKATLNEIKQMTIQDTKIFWPKLKKLLNDCGVALVALPNLKNSGISGATKWINREKVMVAINTRGKDADKFWFSLVHEIYHVFQKKVKKIMVRDAENIFSLGDELEAECDRFSSEFWIPQAIYRQFLSQSNGKFTEQNIKVFADFIGVHPGIVVGRLQHDKRVSYAKFNNLKIKYEITVS